MAIKSQGTALYFVDNITTPKTPILVRMNCPTGISGVGGGTKQQINVTCLDEMSEERFEAGLGTPNALSIPYNFDPALVSHQVLDKLKKSGYNTQWCICLSDGDAAPTLAAGVVTIKQPDGRTSVTFTAYVSENNKDIQTNDVVKGTLSLQRSGDEIWKYKA